MLVLALLLSLAGCGKKEAEPVYKTASDYFPIKVGGKTVQMQLAVHVPEMTRGLMGRRDLAPNQGMIFVYMKPTRVSFYMRNTPTPLDIGYFTSDGVLREVYPMYPFDEKSIPSRSEAIRFALEMNQHWYRDNEVKPGAQLDLKALAAALKARGFRPAAFGLE